MEYSQHSLLLHWWCHLLRQRPMMIREKVAFDCRAEGVRPFKHHSIGCRGWAEPEEQFSLVDPDDSLSRYSSLAFSLFLNGLITTGVSRCSTIALGMRIVLEEVWAEIGEDPLAVEEEYEESTEDEDEEGEVQVGLFSVLGTSVMRAILAAPQNSVVDHNLGAQSGLRMQQIRLD